ncbi:MAG: penicillin-binding protein activator, partial [Deltaproteobacteria bacterium]
NHFWDAVEARRHEVRAAERYDHDETTFGPIVKRLVGRYYLDYRPEYKRELERIKAEITDPYRRRKAIEKLRDEIPPVTDFDVLFIPDRYQTVSLIAPALAVEDVITNVCEERDLERIKKTTGKNRLGLVRLLGTNTWNHPDLVERGGKYVRCAIFVDGFFAGSARKATAEFVHAFQKVHGEGRTPGYLEATGYDSAAIVKAAITKHAPQTRAEMREALAHTDGFPGATGEIRFDAEGEVQKKLFFLTVDRKEGIVEVDVEHWPAPPGG